MFPTVKFNTGMPSGFLILPSGDSLIALSHLAGASNNTLDSPGSSDYEGDGRRTRAILLYANLRDRSTHPIGLSVNKQNEVQGLVPILTNIRCGQRWAFS